MFILGVDPLLSRTIGASSKSVSFVPFPCYPLFINRDSVWSLVKLKCVIEISQSLISEQRPIEPQGLATALGSKIVFAQLVVTFICELVIQGQQLEASYDEISIPYYHTQYQQVGGYSYSEYIVYGSGKSFLNKASITQLIHEINGLLHISLNFEVDIATTISKASVIIRSRVVLLLYFDNLSYFYEKEDGQCRKYDEDTHKADNCLAIRYLFYLSVDKQKVNEFVFYLY